MSHPHGPVANLNPRPLMPKAESGTTTSISPSLEKIPEGDHDTKRRCISNACMPCRKRKSKCDGGRPSCNACLSVYDTDCLYDLDSDHRRKGALKRDIKELTEEKRKLLEERATLVKLLSQIREGSESQVDDIVQNLRSVPYKAYEAIAMGMGIMDVTKRPDSSTMEAELAKGANPLIETDGELRHYGHTSLIGMVPSGNQPVQNEAPFKTWTRVSQDKSLINHLLDLYFAWSHPFYLLFSEEVFRHGLAGKKIKYCTPLLFNAILAVGCNFSNRLEAREDPRNPQTVGSHFFAEAKRLLNEDDRPSLTAISALGVMSIRQAMNNQDSSGWMYAHRMMAMAVELGLHMSYGVQPSTQVTATEIEVRRITFWGAFNLETTWAICVGRISCFPRTAVRLEKPHPRPNLESKMWKPYGHPLFPHASTEMEQAVYTYNLLLHLSQLHEIHNDVIFMFYAPRDRTTSRKLQQFHERYRTWHKNLPPCLSYHPHIQYNKPILPHVLSLHLWYHSSIIHLFRPSLHLEFVHQYPTPLSICSEAAERISKLLTIYRATYGFRNSVFIICHCVVTAATIHAVNMSAELNKSSGAQSTYSQHTIWLKECITAINEMHCLFPWVARYIASLQGLLSRHMGTKNIPESITAALSVMSISSDDPSSRTSSTSSLTPSRNLSTSTTNTSTTSRSSLSEDSSSRRPPSPRPINTDTNTNTNPPTLQPLHDRKTSAPELIELPPTLNSSNIPFQTQPNIYWTPFPEISEGIPLAPPPMERMNASQNMDINAMLDHSADGDWAQLNKDGFVVSTAVADMGIGGDGMARQESGSGLWVNWDGQLM